MGDRSWITRGVAGIVLATFLSDVSHEMSTAVLPLYLAGLGLGPAALGLMEGIADFLVSISKLAGGAVGHRVRRKKPWATLGYLVTVLATGAMALVNGLGALVSLRGSAWFGRGFRGPLRDYLLGDAVEPTHFGRAYGLERAGDMLGAVAGPLLATLLIWAGTPFRAVILWTLAPGLLAAAALFFLATERESQPAAGGEGHGFRATLPRRFWVFLIGVFLYGLGDFSRTFLIWLAARALGEDSGAMTASFSLAVLLYTLHNLVSAAAAYPVGRLGDRWPKLPILVAGYGMGVGTNLILAFFSGSVKWLAGATALSGVYIAVEETLEKAVVADLLPRELRSLGFGILAFANSAGDMVSSLYVGHLLEANRPGRAFGIAALFGLVGVGWMAATSRRGRRRQS